MAEEISKPLCEAHKITMVSSGAGEVGAAKLSGEVLDIMTRLPDTVEKLTGVSISQVTCRRGVIRWVKYWQTGLFSDEALEWIHSKPSLHCAGELSYQLNRDQADAPGRDSANTRSLLHCLSKIILVLAVKFCEQV